MGPVEALLMTFAYEKRTGETVSKEDMACGKLGQSLQDCDFELANQVFQTTPKCSLQIIKQFVINHTVPRLVS